MFNSCSSHHKPAGLFGRHRPKSAGHNSEPAITAWNVDWTNDDKSEFRRDDNDDSTGADVGTTYVRWGRTVCPDTAELVYEGK